MRKKKNRRAKLKGRLKFILLIIALIIGAIFIKDKLPLDDLNLSDLSFLGNENIVDDHYKSEYIYLLAREDETELGKKNHKAKAYPASLTKMMTVLVALEHIEDLSEIAPVDVATYQDMVANNASMAGFYGREMVSYRDLLYGTMLSSGGEAANSLAINISGDVKSFVALMNEKSKEIGLKKTNFTNPEGLHDGGQYTTASDMGKLLDYALEDGDFKAIFTKESYRTTSTLDHPDGILLNSTVLSRLHGREQAGFQIIGGKSGTTSEAGECWATLAVKDGKEYICIVMGAPLDDVSNPSGDQILDTLDLYKSIE